MRATIAYQPALDGVRALAVVAVLLFHGGVAGFSGGYLGVSVFFTLSGYLITSLLVHEHETTGTIDLGAFYGRRLKRLMPASVLCLVAVAIAAWATDWFDRVASLRSHVVGSVLQVANWVLLAGDGSYQDLLAQESGAASPLEHFWSLAIEEQFYWIWPPVMVLLLSRVAAPQRRTKVVAGITAAGLAAAPVIAAVWGPDAAYWSTPARIGEILVGAWLAMALRHRSVDPRAAWAAPAGLTALAIGVVTFPASGGPAYHGGLALVALASGALLIGLQADGPLRRALAWRPLVGLGKISYGVYLFHWPLFVLLDERRTDLDGAALLLLRLAATLAVALVSYRLIESPVRHARTPRRVTFSAAAGATVAVAVVAIAIVPSGLGTYWTIDADTAEAAAIDASDDSPLIAPSPSTVAADTVAPSTVPSTVPGTTEPSPPSAPPATVPTALAPIGELPRPVRVLVIGDSTANALGAGVVAWAAEHPGLAQAEVVAAPGCGFVQGGERRTGDSIEPDTGCVGWVVEQVVPAIEQLKPDVVVAMVSSWDLIDRRWDGPTLIGPSDPEYVAHLQTDYRALVDQVLGAGAGTLAFVRHPVPNVWWLDDATGQSDPLRHEPIYALYDDLSAASEGVRVIDLAGWMRAAQLDTDRNARPDGIHLDRAASQRVVEEMLGDELMRVALGLPGNWSDAPE